MKKFKQQFYLLLCDTVPNKAFFLTLLQRRQCNLDKVNTFASKKILYCSQNVLKGL